MKPTPETRDMSICTTFDCGGQVTICTTCHPGEPIEECATRHGQRVKAAKEALGCE